MKSNFALFCLAIAICFAGCGDVKNDKALLEFSISFDELVHYLPPNSPIVKISDAHSGVYSLLADSAHVYNAVFESKIQDICNKEISKITIEGFVKPTSNAAKGCFVISIQNPAGVVIEWVGSKAAQVVTKPSEWTPFKMILPLKPESKQPLNVIKFYGWNGNSADATYFDDIHVVFE